MGEFVRSQNVKPRLLERVTDESNRQHIINMLAKERQKQKTLAIVEMFSSLNTAILFGLIGCGLVACVIGALMYDVGRLLPAG